MAKREWIGNYTLHIEEYLSYKNEWVKKTFDLGKCLGVDEACERAATCIMREFATSKVRNAYLVDGWGNTISM